MSKLIFFGVGKRFNRVLKERDRFLIKHKILFAVDNNKSLWGKETEGVPIYMPEKIMESEYDYIAITVLKSAEIIEQLLQMGVSESKILTYRQLLAFDRHGEHWEYGKKYCIRENSLNILLVASKLSYDGAAIAVINAARALCLAGKNILLAAPDAESRIIEEITANDISLTIVPGLYAPADKEREWASLFDCIIINSFVMLSCVYEFQNTSPIIWWLHESSLVYPSVFYDNTQYQSKEVDVGVQIVAVSNVAKRCFEKYYPGRVNGILPIAIPDAKYNLTYEQHEKLVFAYVGSVAFHKGVHIILDSYEELLNRGYTNTELWIIGKQYDDIYGADIIKRIKQINSVRYLGELTQAELDEIYKEIDTIICASEEEALSITCIDAMKNEKLCIASNGAGISEYLSHEEDALLFNPGNSNELLERMIWQISHRREARQMGISSRQIYLDNFTYTRFNSRIMRLFEVMEISMPNLSKVQANE